ncbi:MAG: hypothetical protein H6901_07915 [Rhodobacteraceae bacterium]|nr:hypothetical protein [Paracoccaceae bacterium]MCP5342124.1 hypothetical protein [Paracoccaceae bacterium]
MTGQEVIFDPLLPWPAIWGGALGVALMLGLAVWRGLSGWWLRALAAIVLLAAVAQPSLQTEERRAQSDIVILVVDESASQRISGRAAQTAAAVARVEAEVAALPNTELRKVVVGDDAGDGGTLALTALARELAQEPRARVAGAVLVSDGQVHDLEVGTNMPAPLNVLLTGQKTDWDRRLMIRTAPTFGIIGEPLSLTLRVEEQGAMPAADAGRDVTLKIAVDGAPAQDYVVPVGVDLDLPLTLEHGGQNVVQIALETAAGELTDRNNAAVVQINGVRDRLRVLLISGEPYAGERTWRNLLKSDSAVDLVHFTILRPPDKQDGVPVSELSLIAFPTRELFVDKISEFDLIIFDRYQLRGILPAAYLNNIRTYVEDGGAVLVSAGPDFASVESIYHSGLGPILPARPSARILDEGYRPLVSELGQRHPVTEGLETYTPEGGVEGTIGAPTWGRWLRIVELTDAEGQTVMEGPEGRPLLVLNRVGKGRVALLASDNAWLWGRGFEGGGPQLELLRRLAHWLMKEPDLEEEALNATAEGLVMTITRRSLSEGAREVTVTAQDGTETVVQLTEKAPGRYSADWVAPDIGLYRLSDGEIDRVMALGPAAPREFEETIASEDKLKAVVARTNGGFLRLSEGMPDIRPVRAGRPAAGRGWIGVTPRGAYQTVDIHVMPILPAWAFVLLAGLLSIAAWIREGRR